MRSARQAYTEAAVLTAPPERLVVMLYEGAISFLARTVAALRGERAARSRCGTCSARTRSSTSSTSRST